MPFFFNISFQSLLTYLAGFRIRIRIRRIRMFLPCPDPDPHKFADPDPDPGKKVRKWMNKSLFCRVGDVQCKQFHFFCSDFKHPLLRIIWNVKKTQKKNSFFPFTPSPLPRIPPGSGSGPASKFLPGSGSGSAKKKMRIRNPVYYSIYQSRQQPISLAG